MSLSRPLVLASAFLFTVNSSRAQQPSLPRQPASQQLPMESVLSKTLVLITTWVEGYAVPFRGTGFLVRVDDSRLPAGQAFGYLVTNRHVAEAIFKDASGQCKGHQITQTLITLNLKSAVNGNRMRLRPILGTPEWYFPEDPGIDLAVLPGFGLPSGIYDAEKFPTDSFLTPDLWEQVNVAPGDRLFTAGFFRLYPGTHQFQPMLREGSLAMVPDDTMASTLCGAPAKVYLADLHVIAGNSGSPVFLAPRLSLGGVVAPPNGGLPYYLLGVVSGYMYEDSELTLRIATDYEAVLHANSGIATVVPAEQLKALLFSRPLQQRRDQVVGPQKPQK